MNVHHHRRGQALGARSGFTLAEVLISMTITGAAVAAIWAGYLLVAQRTEWSAASAAAQTQALRRLEQLRAGRWDPFDPAYPTRGNDLAATNFWDLPELLDVPQNGTNALTGTNHVAIVDLSVNPPLKTIQVDCVWSLPSRGELFTNTVITYRAPDQ